MRAAAIAVVLVLAVVAGAQENDAKKELAKFEGTWVMTAFERDGQQAGADQVADIKLIIQGNKRILKKGDEVVGESTFKVDPAKNPGVIYVTVVMGPFKDKTLPGIYKFEGDSQFVCIALNGVDPPKGFATEVGDGHLVQIFTKEKKK